MNHKAHHRLVASRASPIDCLPPCVQQAVVVSLLLCTSSMGQTLRSKRLIDNAIAGTPPDPMRLRSDGGPYCTDYGKHRNIQYAGQGYFFCSQCDLWDAKLPSINKRINRNSVVFRCRAKHTSYCHPTDFLERTSRNLFVAQKQRRAHSFFCCTVDEDEPPTEDTPTEDILVS